jgi:hypothetical protein
MLNLLKREAIKRLYGTLPVGQLVQYAADFASRHSQLALTKGPNHPDTRAIEFELGCINGALTSKLRH